MYATRPETSAPGVPDGGMAIVEVSALVVVPYGEVPDAATPRDGAIEVFGACVETILPVEKDVGEVSVAVVPVVAPRVGTAHVEEVLEVDLVDLVVLCGSKVELIGHLVSEEVGLLLSFVKRHDSSTE